jgi:hypothetical protein
MIPRGAGEVKGRPDCQGSCLPGPEPGSASGSTPGSCSFWMRS